MRKGTNAVRLGFAMVVALMVCLAATTVAAESKSGKQGTPLAVGPQSAAVTAYEHYACENDLIEIMFAPDSKVRMRNGVPVDLATRALDGVEDVIGKTRPYEWARICEVAEGKLDQIQERAQENLGEPVYNLNNIYRLRIASGQDIWALCAELEKLPGISSARPVPKPTPAPVPPQYEANQTYLDSSGANPSGVDAEYAWTQTGGTGTGVTVCDLEYGWNYSHYDIPKAVNSQINPNPVALPTGETDDHGTAVIGMLVATRNAYGISGICYGSTLKTCGTYYGSTPAWNVPGAIAYALDSLSAGDVLLLEQQWDYGDPTTAYPDYIPIEWWTNTYPSAQSPNGVYVAIQNAIGNGIHVVEAGGNGGAPTLLVGVDTDLLTWQGNSGAVIVGAGGMYSGGTYPEGNRERLSFSSYGSRFDLQGCGENVYTTGYGLLYSAEGKNYYYTNVFAGTSSSAPCIAGAIACCVGRWTALGYPVAALTPKVLRDILVNTGKAQVIPPAGHIGPRPDLKAAFAQLVTFVDASAGPLGDAGRPWGIAWGDYDNDGDQDLFFPNLTTPARLLRNDGNGVFTDVTTSPFNVVIGSNAVAWGDYDNDGDLDLFIGCVNGYVRIYRNDGGGTFVNATLSPLADLQNINFGAWGDYDRDGDIDLFMTSSSGMKLFRNDGNANFVDVSGPFWRPGSYQSAAWGDYDNDGWLDLYVSSWDQNNRLYHNSSGTMSEYVSMPLLDAGKGEGVAWGDYDNDGDLDIYLANWDTAHPNKLFRNDGGGTFTDVTTYPLNDNGQNVGPYWADYDNDGDLDLYVSGYGSQNKLYRNDGGGTFVDATPTIMAIVTQSAGAGWADYDGDGDVDLYAAFDGSANRLYRNQIGSGNHWLHVNLIGMASNKAAIGARVRVVSGTLKQIREISGGASTGSQCSLPAEFGLGSRTQVDSVIVKWPSDSVSVVLLPGTDQVITITEPTSFLCGDANGDDAIDISDAVFLISYIFSGGAAPDPLEAGDANCDDAVDISDAVYLISFIFSGGAAPCAACK